jgi:hypothetical protein
MSTRKVNPVSRRKSSKAPKNPLPENIALQHDLMDISSTKDNLKTIIAKITEVKRKLRIPPPGKRNNNMNIAFPTNTNEMGNFRYANKINSTENKLRYKHILEIILELRTDLIIQLDIILSHIGKHIKDKTTDIFTSDVCKNIYSYLDFIESISAIIPKKKHDYKLHLSIFEGSKFQSLMNTILTGGTELKQQDGFYHLFKIY